MVHCMTYQSWHRSDKRRHVVESRYSDADSMFSTVPNTSCLSNPVGLPPISICRVSKNSSVNG